jgi:hypothetical protein
MSTPVHLASRAEVFEMSPSQRVNRAVRWPALPYRWLPTMIVP